MNKVLCAVSMILALAAPLAMAQEDTYDFSVSETYLTQLSKDGILPTIQVHVDARTKKVHLLAADCEIHMATTPKGELASPPSVVVEPPNVCKFAPPDTPTTTESRLRNVVWPNKLDDWVIGQDCEVTGFPRIFTEHAQGAGDPANPNHVLEIHPVLSIKCGSNQLDFTSYLVAIPGMRAVKPDTAASCISQRTLEVRYADGQYEFREAGGQCGNFAIVEVQNIKPDWIRKLKGGHSAIARVSADGQSITTLKIYTLEGTKADQWLGNIDPHANARLLLHGMFTYDYFSIIRSIESSDGSLGKPADWTPVKHPLAFVVFGPTDTVPWTED